MAAFGAVAIHLGVVYVGAALGIVTNTPESAIGYVIFFVIMVFSLVPLLMVPMSALGIGWVMLTRSIRPRPAAR